MMGDGFRFWEQRGPLAKTGRLWCRWRGLDSAGKSALIHQKRLPRAREKEVAYVPHTVISLQWLFQLLINN